MSRSQKSMSCQMKRDVYIPELRTKLSTATTQLVNVPLVAAFIHWLKLPTLISLQFESDCQPAPLDPKCWQSSNSRPTRSAWAIFRHSSSLEVKKSIMCVLLKILTERLGDLMRDWLRCMCVRTGILAKPYSVIYGDSLAKFETLYLLGWI